MKKKPSYLKFTGFGTVTNLEVEKPKKGVYYISFNVGTPTCVWAKITLPKPVRLKGPSYLVFRDYLFRLVDFKGEIYILSESGQSLRIASVTFLTGEPVSLELYTQDV